VFFNGDSFGQYILAASLKKAYHEYSAVSKIISAVYRRKHYTLFMAKSVIDV
jgi:hypothetical protein